MNQQPIEYCSLTIKVRTTELAKVQEFLTDLASSRGEKSYTEGVQVPVEEVKNKTKTKLKEVKGSAKTVRRAEPKKADNQQADEAPAPQPKPELKALIQEKAKAHRKEIVKHLNEVIGVQAVTDLNAEQEEEFRNYLESLS